MSRWIKKFSVVSLVFQFLNIQTYGTQGDKGLDDVPMPAAPLSLVPVQPDQHTKFALGVNKKSPSKQKTLPDMFSRMSNKKRTQSQAQNDTVSSPDNMHAVNNSNTGNDEAPPLKKPCAREEDKGFKVLHVRLLNEITHDRFMDAIKARYHNNILRKVEPIDGERNPLRGIVICMFPQNNKVNEVIESLGSYMSSPSSGAGEDSISEETFESLKRECIGKKLEDCLIFQTVEKENGEAHTFVFSFGMAHQFLERDKIQNNFGLKTTANLNPEVRRQLRKIKSKTVEVNPIETQKKRFKSSLSALQDPRSSIKSLGYGIEGSTWSYIEGADSLTIKFKQPLKLPELKELCDALLKQYQSDTYKRGGLGWIDDKQALSVQASKQMNMDLYEELKEHLERGLRDNSWFCMQAFDHPYFKYFLMGPGTHKDLQSKTQQEEERKHSVDELLLKLTEIFYATEEESSILAGKRKEKFFKRLDKEKILFFNTEDKALKDGELDGNLYKLLSWSIVKGGVEYLLEGGKWMQLGERYTSSLNTSIDALLESDHQLPPAPFKIPNDNKPKAKKKQEQEARRMEWEDEYNKAIAQKKPESILLDKREVTVRLPTATKDSKQKRKNRSNKGKKNSILSPSPVGKAYFVEMADVILEKDNTIEIIHVKVGTNTSDLNHLFSQGCTAAEALKQHASYRFRQKISYAFAELELKIEQDKNPKGIKDYLKDKEEEIINDPDHPHEWIAKTVIDSNLGISKEKKEEYKGYLLAKLDKFEKLIPYKGFEPTPETHKIVFAILTDKKGKLSDVVASYKAKESLQRAIYKIGHDYDVKVRLIRGKGFKDPATDANASVDEGDVDEDDESSDGASSSNGDTDERERIHLRGLGPNGQKLYFKEKDIIGDGDCALTCLEIPRTEAVDIILTELNTPGCEIQGILEPEILELLKMQWEGDNLPPEELKKRKVLNALLDKNSRIKEACENYYTEKVRREEIVTSIGSKISKPDVTCRDLLEKHKHLISPEDIEYLEQANKEFELSLEKLELEAKNTEVSTLYVQEYYKDRNGWFAYTPDSASDKSLSLIDILAKKRQHNLKIWIKDSDGNLKIGHQYIIDANPGTSTKNLLFTRAGETGGWENIMECNHFNLLIPEIQENEVVEN